MDFEEEVRLNIERIGRDEEFARLSRAWTVRSSELRYSYNFKWLGLPIIQLPQDIVAMQEIIYRVRPDVVVETGIARGGSSVFYASLLRLIGKGKVVSVERDLRPGNREALAGHPMKEHIDVVEGDSTSGEVVAAVRARIRDGDVVLVCLDSHHAHAHVLRELELYAPLVSVGSYIVVFDTVVELLPEPSAKTRAWGKGDNPWTAVGAFLERNDSFRVDRRYDHKLGVSYAPGGYLERIQ